MLQYRRCRLEVSRSGIRVLSVFCVLGKKTYRKFDSVQSKEIIQFLALIDCRIDALLDSVHPLVFLLKPSQPSTCLCLVELAFHIDSHFVGVQCSHFIAGYPREEVQPFSELGGFVIQHRRVNAKCSQISQVITDYSRSFAIILRFYFKCFLGLSLWLRRSYWWSRVCR